MTPEKNVSYVDLRAENAYLSHPASGLEKKNENNGSSEVWTLPKSGSVKASQQGWPESFKAVFQ